MFRSLWSVKSMRESPATTCTAIALSWRQSMILGRLYFAAENTFVHYLLIHTTPLFRFSADCTFHSISFLLLSWIMILVLWVLISAIVMIKDHLLLLNLALTFSMSIHFCIFESTFFFEIHLITSQKYIFTGCTRFCRKGTSRMWWRAAAYKNRTETKTVSDNCSLTAPKHFERIPHHALGLLF